MCKIVEVLGVPPPLVLERASRTEKFFEKGPGGNWILRRPRDGRKVGGATLSVTISTVATIASIVPHYVQLQQISCDDIFFFHLCGTVVRLAPAAE